MENSPKSKIAQIQSILGVEPDSMWGPASRAALDKAINGDSPDGIRVPYRGQASSFADPADIRAFINCKMKGGYSSKGVWHPGGSDSHCFGVGDNGEGCWGDNTKEGSGPCCALQGHHMVAKWGSRDAAKHRDVIVTINGQTHTIPVKDRLTDDSPNGAVIDLNPDACKLWGLTPPMMVEGAEWRWA